MNSTGDPKIERIRIVSLTLLGAVVRLVGLGQHALWPDEALRILWAAHAANEASASLWEQATVGHAGAVFVTWLTGCLSVHTNSLFWLRLTQALCSSACIPLFYVLARRYLRDGALLGAVALMALSPMHIAIARQAEEYSFLVFFALLATIVVTRIVDTREVRARDAWAVGAVCLLGFFGGGYMVLPWLLALALSLIWLLRGSVGLRQWGLLGLSQVPMVAVFCYSLTFWAFSPRPAIPAYLELMREQVRIGAPGLPGSVMVDLFFYGQLWSWGPNVGPWIAWCEHLIALALAWFLWRGCRALRESGRVGRLPMLAVLIFVTINMIVFLSYSGLPFYFPRIYAPSTVFLYILFAAGLARSLPETRRFALVFFGAFIIVSTIALKLDMHPARPFVLHRILARLAARIQNKTVYVHPGEFSQVLQVEPRNSGLTFKGVWREEFSTPDATIGLNDPMPEEVRTSWVARISGEQACVLVIDQLQGRRDRNRSLQRTLVDQEGYVRLAGDWAVQPYCPPDSSGP